MLLPGLPHVHVNMVLSHPESYPRFGLKQPTCPPALMGS